MFSVSSQIQVAAPKARVIDSVTKNLVRETHAAYESFTGTDGTLYYNREFKSTATMSFPEDKAAPIESGGEDNPYVIVPSLEEGQCAEIVCGRPFVDSGGNSLLASHFSADACDGTSSWLGETSELGNSVTSIVAQVSSPAKNITSQKNDLGEEWTMSALGEHASVASFAAFSIALMTNGAPSDLVEDSLKAARDEVRHAKVSFEIASKLVGKDLGPGPLPPSGHQFSHDLTALAMSVAKEGCVDETLSALAAAAEVELIDEVLQNGAEEGTKYSGTSTELLVWIRNELHNISIDESNHSALAWRTLDWVCAVNADACEIVRRSVLDENKLITAFQLRFSRNFDDSPKLLKRMMVAWRNIYTGQKILPSYDVATDSIGGSACIDSAVEEGSSNDLPKASIISRLVENISLRGSYK